MKSSKVYSLYCYIHDDVCTMFKFLTTLCHVFPVLKKLNHVFSRLEVITSYTFIGKSIQSFVHDPLFIISKEETFLQDFLEILKFQPPNSARSGLMIFPLCVGGRISDIKLGNNERLSCLMCKKLYHAVSINCYAKCSQCIS